MYVNGQMGFGSQFMRRISPGVIDAVPFLALGCQKKLVTGQLYSNQLSLIAWIQRLLRDDLRPSRLSDGIEGVQKSGQLGCWGRCRPIPFGVPECLR